MLILTILNTALILLVGTVTFFNRKYILDKEKQARGIVSLTKLKKQERDAVDEINKRFSRQFQENVDFFDSF